MDQRVGAVISTACMYGVLSLVLKLWGGRYKASTSVATVAVMTLVGAIAARASLGPRPTMLLGLIALLMLLVLERSFGALRRFSGALMQDEQRRKKKRPRP